LTLAHRGLRQEQAARRQPALRHHREERNDRDLAREATARCRAWRGADTEAPPVKGGEVAETDADAGPADLDAASTGMVMLLRAALRLMRS
jgi:hypothetical protein